MSHVASVIDRVLEASVVGSFTSIGSAVRERLHEFEEFRRDALAGKTVLVTGANSGLGFEIAKGVGRLGAHVEILVRSQDKADDTMKRLRDEVPDILVDAGIADLANFASVDAFVADFQTRNDRLDVLINNAGAMFDQRKEVPAPADADADTIEKTVAVHVVGPFRLTAGLLPLLRSSARPDDPSRVITMASGGMYAEKLSIRRLQSPDDYKPTTSYARAKRAQVVLTRQANERVGTHADGDVVFHVMHPGWAATPGVEESLPVFNKIIGPLLRSPADGADTAVWLAASDCATVPADGIFLDRAPRPTHKLPSTRHEPKVEDALWTELQRLSGVDCS